MSHKEIIRRHYVFHGEVQGVGFRWYATQAASASGVSGWIRNEYDGSVTMELQRTPAQIEGTLEMIKKDSWIRISEMTYSEMEPDHSERRFTVRY